MHTALIAILQKSALSVDEKVSQTTEYLSRCTDRGISEVLHFLQTTDDPVAATYPANYLALLPGLYAEKQRAVEYCLQKHPAFLNVITNLVQFLPDETISALIEYVLQHPGDPELESLLYELASYFPHRLRPFAAHRPITSSDTHIQEALLSGGPDEWAFREVAAYRQSGDPLRLRRLSRFRTDRALDDLITLQESVSEEDADELKAFIEGSGVFPDTRRASVYFHASRGIVVPRGEGSHAMGDGFPFAVPRCEICEKPAIRIITLAPQALPFDLESPVAPSFFWHQCPHIPSCIYVHITDQRIEGLMTPMTEDAVDTHEMPALLDLVLEKHPNQYGPGTDAIAGFSLHQVGGYPRWIRPERFPRCPGCSLGMRFTVSIDSGMTSLGPLPLRDEILYGFWCPQCSISCTLRQGEDED